MTLEILISLFFLLLAFGIVLLIFATKHSYSIVHAVFFVLFVQCVHLIRLFSDLKTKYDFSSYILSHFVVLLYLLFFWLCLLLVRKWLPPNRRVVNSVLLVPDIFLVSVFAGWLVFKTYQVLRYGTHAFVATRALTNSNFLPGAVWWENPVEFYLTAFAIGASVAYIIKLIAIKKYASKFITTAAFLFFNVVYVVTHSAGVGPRRYIFLLFLIFISSLAWRDGKKMLSILYWQKFILPGLVIVGLVVYYQAIRTNFYLPDIAAKLQSPKITEFSKGIVQVLIPLPERNRVELGAPFFREGPFETIYQVIKKRIRGEPGSRGKIVENSFLMVVPRVIAGSSKTSVGTDDIFASEMGIYSSGNMTDVATSLIAVFVADYGLPGFFIPPVIIALALASFSITPKHPSISSSIKTLFWLNVLFAFAGNVEGDLVGVLSILRDATILILALVPVQILEAIFIRYSRHKHALVKNSHKRVMALPVVNNRNQIEPIVKAPITIVE